MKQKDIDNNEVDGGGLEVGDVRALAASAASAATTEVVRGVRGVGRAFSPGTVPSGPRFPNESLIKEWAQNFLKVRTVSNDLNTKIDDIYNIIKHALPAAAATQPGGNIKEADNIQSPINSKSVGKKTKTLKEKPKKIKTKKISE